MVKGTPGLHLHSNVTLCKSSLSLWPRQLPGTLRAQHMLLITHFLCAGSSQDLHFPNRWSLITQKENTCSTFAAVLEGKREWQKSCASTQIGHLHQTPASVFWEHLHVLGSNLEVFGPNPSLQGELKLAFTMEGVADMALGSVVTSVTKGMCGSPVVFSLWCQVSHFTSPTKLLTATWTKSLQGCSLKIKFSKVCSQGKKDSKDRNTFFFSSNFPFTVEKTSHKGTWSKTKFSHRYDRREQQFKNTACQRLNNNLWTKIEKWVKKQVKLKQKKIPISKIKDFTVKTWENNNQNSCWIGSWLCT